MTLLLPDHHGNSTENFGHISCFVGVPTLTFQNLVESTARGLELIKPAKGD